MAKIEDLKKAYAHVANTITLSKFDSKIAESILKNGMKNYGEKYGLDFTDEEIESAIHGELKGHEETEHFHMDNELQQSFSIAMQSVIAGLYDDIAEKEVINGIKTYAESNGFEFTDEDIKKYVKARFAEFNHVADLSPYKLK